jgi:quercetin dioxygenase-like cupin family protein
MTAALDIRTIEDYAPRLEHEGSTKVWWLVDAREMFADTKGSHLDSIAEVEIPGTGAVTMPPAGWKFWYVTSGQGKVLLDGRERTVSPGDFVVSRPGQTLELRSASPNAGVHLLGFTLEDNDGSAAAASYRHAGLDVRSIHDIKPEDIGEGGATVWWLSRRGEFKDATAGGHLELVDEFEVAAGGEVHPHAHETWEFYYGLFGRALMTISGEERTMGPGDLVVIPSDAVHSIKPVGPHTGTRCFCFAVGIKGAREYNYGKDVPTGVRA